jgi:hypothetical protein
MDSQTDQALKDVLAALSALHSLVAELGAEAMPPGVDMRAHF